MCTMYTPDFFITIFFTTLITSSNFLDLFLTALLFFKASVDFWIVFFISSYFRVIFEIAVGSNFSNENRKIFQLFFNILLTIVGLHSVVISGIILAQTLEKLNSQNQSPDSIAYPIFHITSESLSLIRIYCYINLGVRCIPQLFIMSIFIGLYHPTGTIGYLSTANILLNMALFSFTISISLPIRNRPRIFSNFVCLVFSAISKFLATVCGCCATLTVFMTVFKEVQYYAFLVHIFKIIIWAFPCQVLLYAQNISKLQFFVYLFFFPLVFNFIFIHPFQKTWRLFYYFSYLSSSLMDLAFLGVWGDAKLTDLTYYSILKIVQIGFLSCFGLLNSFQKVEVSEVINNVTPKVDKPNMTEDISSVATEEEKVNKTEQKVSKPEQKRSKSEERNNSDFR